MFHWKYLYETIDVQRGYENLSWRKYGKSHKIPPSTFTRISQGKPVSVQNLILLLRLVQVPFERFLKGKK